VRSNTATATTATAEPAGRYRGRFAPSPTGALHLGSLVAALGSYLDARHHGGQWLIRIEDLDTPRVLPGAATKLLDTLSALGLESDLPVLYQSTRLAAYAAALDHLQHQGLLYACSCSRRDTTDGPYAGLCRRGTRGPPPHALRLRLPDDAEVSFCDVFQGPRQQSFARLGDPILKRRDGQIAYQLAVVVDDAQQGVTHVIRGGDLIDSTGWQLQLRSHLQLPPVIHGHLPVVVETDGNKLAKSASSAAISGWNPQHALVEALWLLRQEPPAGLETEPVPRVLDWAVRNWRPAALTGLAEIRAPQRPHLEL
jgi:glutamyl-Q tRNA(Asp) synthetase